MSALPVETRDKVRKDFRTVQRRGRNKCTLPIGRHPLSQAVRHHDDNHQCLPDAPNIFSQRGSPKQSMRMDRII